MQEPLFNIKTQEKKVFIYDRQINPPSFLVAEPVEEIVQYQNQSHHGIIGGDLSSIVLHS